MKYFYFPGCVIPMRENAYELSARKVLGRLGVELIELKGVSCCGYFLEAVDHLSAAVLASRNLCLAEESGGYDILTLCPTCSGHLIRVKRELSEDPKFNSTVNGILSKINKTCKGTPEAKHITKVLVKDIGVEKISETIVRPLKNVKVAPFYGCHIMRPSGEIKFDSPENPKLLDSLIKVTGAKLLNYDGKRGCCGAPVMGVDENLSFEILRDKLTHIRGIGADAIVTICAFCHTQLDLNQLAVEERYQEKYQIPVIHFTQLLGLAQGFTPDDLGLYENRVPADKIVEIL